MNADRRLADDYATLGSVTELVRKVVATMPAPPEGVEPDKLRSWEIRLLCPRGHFCVDLAAVELRDDLVLSFPLGKGQLADDAPDYVLNLVKSGVVRAPRGAPGWIKQSGNRVGAYSRAETIVECGKKRCSYSGAFEYFALAGQLRSAAVGGHSEYRLTE